MTEVNVFIVVHIALIIISITVLTVSTLSELLDNEDTRKIEAVSSLFTILFLIFYIYGVYKCETSEWIISDKAYSTENIVAFNDNNLTNGRFYLRHGYIEENLYYQYIVKLNNDGFVTNKVNSSNATLYYTDNNYRVEWYIKTKKWLYFEMKETYNKIYIPEGSITDGYSVDLN